MGKLPANFSSNFNGEILLQIFRPCFFQDFWPPKNIYAQNSRPELSAFLSNFTFSNLFFQWRGRKSIATGPLSQDCNSNQEVLDSLERGEGSKGALIVEGLKQPFMEAFEKFLGGTRKKQTKTHKCHVKKLQDPFCSQKVWLLRRSCEIYGAFKEKVRGI